MPVIVLSNHYSDGPFTIIQGVLPSGFELVNLQQASYEELLEKVTQADYILASGRVKIDRRIVEAAPKLKMIQRTGVGLDSIDLSVLKEKQIPLYVNQGINADSVAEHTVLLMLAALKRLTVVNAQMKEGIWIKQGNGIQNRELKGKCVGLVGMGHIGRKVARILSAFGANIVYTDVRRMPEEMENEYQIRYEQFNQLVSMSDIISLHCPLTEDSRNLFDEKVFKMMKPGSIIVNTARGGLIEEAALVNALANNEIGGAGLDVFSQEPVPSHSKLLGLENVVLTPHIGGVTYDSFRMMMQEAMNNIFMFENGRFSQIEGKKYKF